MKFYILEIIYKIQSFSRKLDETSLIENNHWVSIDELEDEKRVYIFRPNGQLLISTNGIVNKSSWEYLSNGSLLIDINEISYLFKSGFIDETLLALKIDSSEKYALFVNETKYGSEINNIIDLQKYIEEKYAKVSKIDKTKSYSKFKNVMYVDFDNICPGCNYEGIENLLECPSCGLKYN